MPYEPGQAKRQRALEPLRPDVPGDVQIHLWGWIEEVLGSGYEDRKINLLLGYLQASFSLHDTPRSAVMGTLQALCGDADRGLSVIEFLLDGHSSPQQKAHLVQILRAGHSAYTLNDERDGLAWVATPEAIRDVEKAVAASDHGPAHWLTIAWNDAYALDPRPETSYPASIKAVEGALRGIIVPKNDGASITQIINALRDGRSKFAFDLEDARQRKGANEPEVDQVDVVIAMLRSLAYGERIRHGKSEDVNVNSVEEARTALQLAVSLVQFANTGALRLR